MRKLLWICSGLLFVGVGLGACGVNTENVCDYPGACGGDAGTDVKVDASGDTGIDAPPGCDLAKDPKDSIACVADSVGVFVDATKGDDAAGDGSKLKPLKTIGTALTKVGNKPRIYVCEGTYAEDVVLDASHDGVSLYGGWKCADWSYSGGKPVVGKGTLALKVDGVKAAITIADLDVKSVDATVAGQSSVAVFVNASSNVTFLRDKLEAGAGKSGDNGTLTNVTYPLQSDLDGKNASGATGGPANPVTCPGGKVTTGGKGGDGSGGDGDNGLPTSSGGAKGLGGAQSVACSTGGDGAAGKAGKDGDKVAAVGVVGSAGWQSTPGAAGVAGEPGQGGGGGGGRTFNAVSGGGGGGGAGGCGGASGGGGSGGGGSIALVSLASTITVAASEFVATTAGNGGNGLAGQVGQAISGFGGNKSANGCAGGAGGTGGAGGSGGGGAGGVSVGVLWKGTAAPTIDVSTTAKITVAAKGGNKGVGGATPTNDGIDGVAQAVLEVK